MTPYLTYTIIAVTVLTSMRAFKDQSIMQRMLFNPFLVNKERDYLRVLSSAFIHADWVHLGVNMYVLYAFGRAVEQTFAISFEPLGGLLYILLYVLGIGASHLTTFFKHRNDPHYNSLGASGAVSAVLFSYILMYPTNELVFIFLPFIPIPAWIVGIGYLLYEQYMSKKNMTRINHDAHFAGALFGFLFTVAINPSLFPRFFQLIIP